MKCPVCVDVDLQMSERQGVEIDYCPQCRGVWLDRGELDKIIERSGLATRPPERGQAAYREHPRNSQPTYDERGRPPKRRESFLSDLFDFD